MKLKTYSKITAGVLLCGIVGGGLLYTRGCTDKGSDIFSAGFQQEIQPTPIQIESIRNIQKWEFLSIDEEEIIDTAITHWWKPDKRLVRIYRGTLRIGIDFHDCTPDWAMAKGDTAILSLPAIRLLDNRFIDEARTKGFHQEGNWDAQAYNDLYKRAEQRMLLRGMTDKNIKRAEENARLQLTNLFRTLGYKEVKITISPSS